jgi:hypothetical protein
MPNLITTEEQLRQFLSNIQLTVKGETSLFDKLTPHLDAAEQWMKVNLTAEAPFNTIVRFSDGDVTKTLAARIIVAEAFRRAIPSLDLILTPNGFGVVSNNNVAPASKQRVDRLLAAMTEQRDNDIELLIPRLPTVSGWTDSERFQWFAATLFPNIDVVKTLGNAPTDRWNKFLELRPKILEVEALLAEDFFSQELLTVLRQRAASGELSDADKFVVASVRSQVCAVLNGEQINVRRMVDVVNHIRNHAADFPEWHESATAKLFTPPIFTNTKSSPGYFF